MAYVYCNAFLKEVYFAFRCFSPSCSVLLVIQVSVNVNGLQSLHWTPFCLLLEHH